MLKTTYILVITFTVAILSCQDGTSKKEEGKQKFEYIHLLPDSLLNSSQIELKHKLQKAIIDFVVIQDNKFVFKASKNDFKKMGIPMEYYKLFKKNMKDNNKFIRDNKIEDVSAQYDVTIKQLKELMKVK